MKKLKEIRRTLEKTKAEKSQLIEENKKLSANITKATAEIEELKAEIVNLLRIIRFK